MNLFPKSSLISYCLIFSSTQFGFSNAFRAVVVDFAFQPGIGYWYEHTSNNTYNSMAIINYYSGKGVDLIVFPEYVLTGTEVIFKGTQHLDVYSTSDDININTTLCKNSTRFDPSDLEKLSCRAKSGKVGIVVNILEKVDTEQYFSTNVVIDKNGKIVATYRKRIITDESGIRPNPEKERGIFKFVDIKFDGIQFELLVGYDLFSPNELWKNFSITHVIYSGAWISKLPFLAAPSIQSGMAKMHKKTLLAANCKNDQFFGGSGIYSPDGENSFVFGDLKSTKVVTSNEPVNVAMYNASQIPREDMTLYSSIILQEGEHITTAKICKKKDKMEICCSLTYKMSAESGGRPYMLVFYSGILPLHINSESTDTMSTHEYNTGYSACGVVACSTDEVSSCGTYEDKDKRSVRFSTLTLEINKQGNGTEVYFPSTLTGSLAPLNNSEYSVTEEGNSLKMELKRTVSKILTYGFVIRNVAFDGKPAENFADFIPWDSSTLLIVLLSLVIVFIILAIAVFLVRKRIREKGSMRVPMTLLGD